MEFISSRKEGSDRTTESGRVIFSWRTVEFSNYSDWVDEEALEPDICITTPHFPQGHSFTLEETVVYAEKREQTSLKEYYQTLLDRQFSGDIEFQPNIDLTRGSGAFLKRLTTYLLHEIQQDEKVIHDRTIREKYSDLFLSALLQLPHTVPVGPSKNYSVVIASKYVVRAEEYMRAHLSQAITITDLLKICKCGRTALYSSFSSMRGYTPMEFLAEQRLQVARNEIVTSTAETTIACIAIKCGFSHLSRFSIAYRTRFGELPSETLRKS